MPTAGVGYRSLIGITLRGLAARKGLAFASWLLTAIAVASAVVGPSYQGTSANSFVVTQLRAEPRVNTGLSYAYRPTSTAKLPDLTTAMTTADALSRRVSGTAYGDGHAMVWQTLPPATFPHSLEPASPTLLYAPGDCDHVALKGRCPSRTGEIAVEAGDAFTYSLRLGSVVDPYPGQAPFTVVGIYTPRHDAADFAFWFDSEQLRAVPGRLLTIPSSNNVPVTRLAPWFTVSAAIERRSEPWYVSVDQELRVPSTLTPTGLSARAAHVRTVMAQDKHGGLPDGLSMMPGNSLPSVTGTLLARRSVARSTVTPAVLSLILVALVLLSRLLSASMTLRRGELALASLRGYRRRRLWLLGMAEPLVILLAAAPMGIVLGYLAARALARQWLIAGLPVPFVLASGLSAAGVVVATAGVAAGVVRIAVSEPLTAQIAQERRPVRPGRMALVVRLALLAAAAAALVTAWSRSKPAAPDATDLALPLLLATGVGLLTSLAVLLVGSLWMRWSARRRSLASYVAARTVRRRHEGTQVVLPVTAALTVAVFTVGMSAAASTWRTSVAATEVGAGLSFPTTLSINRAVGLTDSSTPRAAGSWRLA